MVYLRKVYPEPIRPIVGRRERWLALGTKDPAEAKVLGLKAALDVEREIQHGRKKLAASRAMAPADLAEDYRVRMLKEDAEYRVSQPLPDRDDIDTDVSRRPFSNWLWKR